MSWMESNLAVCADYMDGVYHQLDYKMGNRAKDVAADGIMMKNGVSDKMIVDFITILEKDGIMAPGSHKNKTAVDTLQSIVNMPKSEFSKYIKENPSPKINMVYNEFQDWKQSMMNRDMMKNGGGVSETPIAMMREVTGRSVGTVPVSEEIYTSQVNDFVNYVYEVYEEQGYTKAQVKTAVNKYIKDLGKEFTYGGGDSLDRERVYEYLLNPSLKGIKNPMMRDGGGVGFSIYENVYIPSLYKMGSPADSSGMVINIFTENGKEMLAIELRNGKSIKIRASKVERMYANGGGVDYTDYKSLLEEERRLSAEYNKVKADYDKEYKEGEFDSLLAQDYKEKMEMLEGKMMEVNNDLLYLQTHGIEKSMGSERMFNGGGVGNQGLLNKNYLDSIPAEKKAFILKGIAEHYGTSVKKVLEEVTSSDAEELADYIMGRGALEVFNAMKSMKMTNGGNMMAAQGMFLDGEFEETVRKVKDYISKYPYVWKNGNKSYVPIEGWQYAASLMGLSARVTEVYAVPEKNGWMAKAEVVNQTGVIVCSGFGFVGRDEEKWAKSTESDLESFSQTKAVSRALRNCISYLIKAAGYSTTPAEEMYGLKGSSKSMNSKKPNLRPIYGVPDIDGQIGPYDMPVQKPIEKASTEERSNISILLQKVWAESKGRGIVLVSPEFMQKIEDNLFDLDATSLSFEVLLADAYDWMIENNEIGRAHV